jgi:hypothetical protein
LLCASLNSKACVDNSWGLREEFYAASLPNAPARLNWSRELRIGLTVGGAARPPVVCTDPGRNSIMRSAAVGTCSKTAALARSLKEHSSFIYCFILYIRTTYSREWISARYCQVLAILETFFLPVSLCSSNCISKRSHVRVHCQSDRHTCISRVVRGFSPSKNPTIFSLFKCRKIP